MFTVYSASAGSGKTYNLVFDYLATCFRNQLPSFLKLNDRQQYECHKCSEYQHILAITFTNNAGREMKERIVQQLTAFAFAQTIDDLNRNDFDNFCEKVFPSHPVLSEKDRFVFLNRTAKTLLHDILYDYARFSVSTIDSFIQRVIRSSALYLKLSMSYAVQIRLSDFFRMAIEQYICHLSQNEKQSEVVVNELLRQLEDKGSANINRFLSQGLQILYYDAEKSHPYIQNFPEITQLSSIVDNWKQRQYSILEQCKNLVKPLADQALDVFKSAENEGITPNKVKKWDIWFAQVKNDPFNLERGFDKSKCHQAMDEKTVFTVAKKGGKAEKEILENLKSGYTEQVKQYFEQIQDIVLKNAKSYFSYQILAKNANQLLILGSLREHIENIKKQTDSFFLSESNPLLNDEIKSETRGEPLFEKLSYYQHFFIDEFQDTSLMQWEDLKPLVINALGQNGTVTLFGDVKQSIYRFRNGEVGLFYNLSNQDRLNATRSEKDLASMLQDYHFEPLEVNYRSYSSVIEFNNHFFEFYAHLLDQDNYYTNVRQKTRSEKTGGLVQIFGYNKLDYKDIRHVWTACTDDFYQNVYLNMRPEEAELLYAVMDARKRGYAFGEMAVLLSGRAKCNEFAQCLMSAGISVVTSESLQLCDNANINLIINTLRFLVFSNDRLAQTEILHYFAQKQGKDFSHALFESDTEQFTSMMEELFGIQGFSDKIETWQKNPFLVTIKDIIRFYDFLSEADPFIADFLDLAFDYSQAQIASIADFLIWWDDLNRYQETIPRLSLSDTANAVQLLTIHASKGLQYKVVITHCTASRQRDAHYWLTDPDSSQSCYVRHEKNLQYSDYHIEYEEEEEKRILDGLNLWYVDFTRACDMLYILTEMPDEGSKSTTKQNENSVEGSVEVASWDNKPNIKQAIKQFVDNKEISIEKNPENIYYYGDFEWMNPKAAIILDNTETAFQVTCSDFSFCDNESLKVVVPESETESSETGTHIHNFLQKLTFFPNSHEECEKLVEEEPEEIRLRLLQLFEQKTQEPRFRPYFYLDEGDRVLNEATIITENGKEKRPDRIVFKPDHVMIIDYKTGKKYENKYKAQLTEYQEYLQKMGFKDVRWEILYID